MDKATVEAYEQRGADWARAREPVLVDQAVDFARAVPDGGLRLDAGAGAGRYTNELGAPVVALDAAATMLRLLGDVAPDALRVQADLEALPFRRASFAGAWANMSYIHVPRTRWPMALADLHRALDVGAAVELATAHGDAEGLDPEHDDIGGRFFAEWGEQAIADVVEGAGFGVQRVWLDRYCVRVRAVRARSLADTVGDGMRLLVCGLNPSEYSADRGVGYARPGNRFWPAAVAAGLVTTPLDPSHALLEHGVGITDLCKRATRASSALTVEEYRHGAARVERLVRWLQPRAVVFVGLEGFRKAVDAKAMIGPRPGGFGGRPAYLMPSTSGQVAGVSIEQYADHLRAAAALGTP